MKKVYATFLLLFFILLCSCAMQEAPDNRPLPAEPSQAPMAAEEAELVSSVYADWSKLAGQEIREASYSSYWPEPQNMLIPDDGYEMLLPFVGLELNVHSKLEGVSWDEYRYGLATAAGALVVEPVYDSVYQLSYMTGTDSQAMPVYVLTQTQCLDGGNGKLLRGAAAVDGSWCTELAYDAIFAIGPDRLLLVDASGFSWFCDMKGNVTRTALQESVFAFWGEWWMEMGGIHSDIACFPAENGDGCWLLNFTTGAKKHLTDVRYCTGFWWDDDMLPAMDRNLRVGYLNAEGEWAIQPQFTNANSFAGEFALVSGSDYDDQFFIDGQGNTVLKPQGHFMEISASDQKLYLDLDASNIILAVYDTRLQPLPISAVGNTWIENWSNLLWKDEQGSLWIWNGEEGVDATEPLADAEFNGLYGKLLRFWREGQYGVYDLEAGRWLFALNMKYQSFLEDTITGEVYIMDGYTGGTVYDCTGQKLFTAAQVGAPTDGIFSVRTGAWSGLMDRDGRWRIRYPIQTGND